jgi:Domain of unknown function (DUF222)
MPECLTCGKRSAWPRRSRKAVTCTGRRRSTGTSGSTTCTRTSAPRRPSGRRQARFEAAKATGKPVGCRDGEFPGEELAMELVDTGAYAGARIDTAIELTARLPRTLAGMADGTIDLTRAMTIAGRTRVMTNANTAYADEVLAAAAPEVRPDQLARKAAALEMKLAPEAVKARKELARHLDQRVEARREPSGNASLAGRELDTADVIASKAHIDAIAVKLRDSGLVDGTLGHPAPGQPRQAGSTPQHQPPTTFNSQRDAGLDSV